MFDGKHVYINEIPLEVVGTRQQTSDIIHVSITHKGMIVHTVRFNQSTH
jgi:hypothetical protein